MKEQFGIVEVGLRVSWTLFFLPILVGRFTGGLILRELKPTHCFVITVIVAITGLIFMFLDVKFLTFLGIVMVGLGYANIFPPVFSITIDHMPERTNELSGLMVMAIAGGAFIPPVMGVVADHTSLLVGFMIPLAAIVYIFWAAMTNLRKI
jgi:FHS family L-fucose permease-like MFS transporter